MLTYAPYITVFLLVFSFSSIALSCLGKGYREGHEDGLQEGYNKGVEEGKKLANKRFG